MWLPPLKGGEGRYRESEKGESEGLSGETMPAIMITVAEGEVGSTRGHQPFQGSSLPCPEDSETPKIARQGRSVRCSYQVSIVLEVYRMTGAAGKEACTIVHGTFQLEEGTAMDDRASVSSRIKLCAALHRVE